MRGGGGGRGRALSLRPNTGIAVAVAVAVAGHLGHRGRPAAAAVPHRLPRDAAGVGVQGGPRPAPALAQRGAVRRRGAETEKNILQRSIRKYLLLSAAPVDGGPGSGAAPAAGALVITAGEVEAVGQRVVRHVVHIETDLK